MLRISRIILIVLALFLGMMLAMVNAESVKVDYLFGEKNLPLIALLIIDLLIGLAIGAVIYAPKLLALRIELDRNKKKLAAAETELRNLRNLPAKDA
jgi:putative membrane protein